MGIAVTIDLAGPLEEHVLAETGGEGGYADAVDYIRDLIRRDMAAVDAHQFRTVKEHLQVAFATPDSDYVQMNADDFIQRLKSRRA